MTEDNWIEERYEQGLEYPADVYVDVETYSTIDIMKSGAYKYVESPDFEIIILCYGINNEPIKTVDLASGEKLPQEFIWLLNRGDCIKHAHNAAFERLCFRAIGFDIPISEWRCSAVKSGYCGLPLALDSISKAMRLGEASKDAKGKALIRYFSIPVKGTKANGGRTRNLPHHDPEKWEEYKEYCKQDVHAERTILQRLEKYTIPKQENILYALDQKINDRGIKVDLEMATNAIAVDSRNALDLKTQMIKLTGVENPHSPAQLKSWLSEEMQKNITTLSKDDIPRLIKLAGLGSVAAEVLELRLKSAKTSIKKYEAMVNCFCYDGRAHGLFQFYGANRTGRWAGRLIQLQNLPQNHLDDLDQVRKLVRAGRYAALSLQYDDLGSILSQLIRTAFIPEEGSTFAVADFSAIEARVIAWLASEQWRLDVFKTHGKIYEASASMMFSVPLEAVTKGSDLRAKGKVAELALGYQGSVGAMKTMGAEKMGLSEKEMKAIVNKWRLANPSIVDLWADIQDCAIKAVKTRKEKVSEYRGISFKYDGYVLTITLPSGRALYYQSPVITQETKYEFFTIDSETDQKIVEWLPVVYKSGWAATGRIWKVDKLSYMGMDQVKKIWTKVDTYGGKLVENIVQAIARDLLAESLINLDKEGFDITMHVHDEVVAEIPIFESQKNLDKMCEIMSWTPEWAEGLPLAADGYITEYYKKD